MLKLATIEYTGNIEGMESQAQQEYYRSPLFKNIHLTSGWITVEPTPGTINFNPSRKCAKVMFYKNEPRTRYGYYAKLKVMINGDLRSY